MLEKFNVLVTNFLRECLFFGSTLFLGFFVLVFFFLGDFVRSAQLFLALFLGFFIVSFAKSCWYRERPEKERHGLDIFDSSFPSMHAVVSTLGFCFGFDIFSFLVWKVLLGVLLFLVLLSSLVLKKHFVKDVFTGVFLGFVLFFVSKIVVRVFLN